MDALDCTPLHLLVTNPNVTVEMVDRLLKSNPQASFSKDKTGNRPIHLACYNQNITVNVIKKLATQKKFYNYVSNTGDKNGDVPTMLAIRNNLDISVKAYLYFLQPIQRKENQQLLERDELEALLENEQDWEQKKKEQDWERDELRALQISYSLIERVETIIDPPNYSMEFYENPNYPFEISIWKCFFEIFITSNTMLGKKQEIKNLREVVEDTKLFDDYSRQPSQDDFEFCKFLYEELLVYGTKPKRMEVVVKNLSENANEKMKEWAKFISLEPREDKKNLTHIMHNISLLDFVQMG